MKTNCPLCKSRETEKKFNTIDHLCSKECFPIYDCSECGVSFTLPELSKKTLSRYYIKQKYQSYKRSFNSLFDVLYGAIRYFNSLNKHSVIKSLIDGDVLDYGSGSGYFAGFLRKKNLTVYEYEPINTNKNKWALVGKELSKKKKGFSVVMLWHVLEHVNNPKKELGFIKTLLKKKSHVVVAMPNKDSYDNKYYNKNWAGYDAPRHRFHFNPLSFRLLCRGLGLKIKKIVPLYYDSYYVSILSEKNKKSMFSFIKGLYIGLLSNVKANKTKSYSSLIYVLENE